MSGIRDLFFDEFFEELNGVAAGVNGDLVSGPSVLVDVLLRHWFSYVGDSGSRDEVLVSVDGGVQVSDFAYGGFVAAARACGVIHRKGEGRNIVKRVKLFAGDVYDNRDRGFIPGYVRMIAEYDAARLAAEKVLAEGGKPLILMDGSLYLARFPYAIREYRNHSDLLADLFNSMSDLRCLARDNKFTIAGVSKDSTVFYNYMMFLREAIQKAGLGRLSSLLDDAGSPHNLMAKVEKIPPNDRKALEPFLEPRPLCDTALVNSATTTEGYTQPLLLAPSIYYGREPAPSLYNRIRQNLPEEKAENVINSLENFFDCPGIATIVWKPTPKSRSFRVDVTADSLGHSEPWIHQQGNRFTDTMEPLEKVLDHLNYWYCNDVEYNIPLKQADQLAHFDRRLYTQKYEPFIIRRLEEAGLDITGSRRMQRDMD